MTTSESEIIAKQQKEIEKLQRKIKRLEKRLVEKKKYELGLLQFTGASPQYIAKIEQKDQEVLSS